MALTSVNSISIGYDDHTPPGGGIGDPVVLVHGHPFDRSMWDPQVADLTAAGYRVITFDLRGYGESEVVPGTAMLSAFAGDAAALLDHLGVARAVFGGLSMGGQIVMEIHRLFPDRVAALLLADTFAQAETDEGKKTRNAMADRLLAEGMDGYAHEVLDKMVAPYNVTELTDVADHVLRMMRNTPPEGAAAALRGRAERPDYADSLTLAAVPALVVVGADDSFTPVSDAEHLHTLLPEATLAVVQGAAHLPNLERPAEFNTILRDFLAALYQEGDRP
jgi:pimeloyl-ACP methyl ester carboxylesterase